MAESTEQSDKTAGKRIPQAPGEKAPAKISRFPGQKFHRVVFTGRTDPNDVPYVPLAINNFELRLQREQEVILPTNFLEVAENASYDNLVAGKTAQQPIMKDGIIRRFPFRIVQDGRSEPTEEDFFEMLNKGNDITNKTIERNSTSQTS